MAAIWDWQRTEFDFLDTSDGEGWSETYSQPLPPPFALQRVICRMGTVGSGTASFTDAALATPSFLLTLNVFLQMPGEQRRYYYAAHGSITSAEVHVDNLNSTLVKNSWQFVPPFDVDVTARAQVPDGVFGWTVGFELACTPVPAQDTSRFLYRCSWRTVGQLAVLTSGKP